MKKHLSSIYTKLKKYNIFSVLSAFFTIFLFYFLMQNIGITCPIKYTTGISCAGCGMSRAWMAVLRLDFQAAFHYHPLFLLPVPTVFLFIFKPKINRNIWNFLLFTIIFLFVIIYLFRMFFEKGEIVVFEPQNNLFFQFIRYLKTI